MFTHLRATAFATLVLELAMITNGGAIALLAIGLPLTMFTHAGTLALLTTLLSTTMLADSIRVALITLRLNFVMFTKFSRSYSGGGARTISTGGAHLTMCTHLINNVVGGRAFFAIASKTIMSTN